MTVVTRKICIVGDFAVGKTSTVERFVNKHFSDEYLTTVGVKVDTREVPLDDKGLSVKLIIWDVAGADRFGEKELAYLRGASGHIFVVDGTRAETVSSVLELREQILETYGASPNVLLLNKSDLAGAWQIGDRDVEPLAKSFDRVFKTSAKRGDNVDLALTHLAGQIVSVDLAS